MADLFNPPFVTILDTNGNPINGGKLKFYLTGTLTPATVYANAAQTTPLTNPVVADAAGRVAAVYLDPAVTYRCRVTDATDTLIKDIDPCSFSYDSDALNTIIGDISSLDDRVTVTEDRLDAMDVVSASVDIIRVSPRPAKWTAPTGMNNPLGIWVDCDGRTFSFNKRPYELTDWTETETGITHYYIDYVNGNDANAGTSAGAGNAWKTFGKAVSSAVDKSIIHLVDASVGYLSHTAGTPNFASRRIKIIGDNASGRTLFSGWRETYTAAYMTWVADGSAFKSTASIVGTTVKAMLDGNHRDRYGLPLPMPHVASLAVCKTTPGSWNWDGTTLSVHMIDARTPNPTDGWIPVTSFSNFNITSDVDLTIENCEFAYNGGAASQASIRISNTTAFVENTKKVALKNVLGFGSSGNAIHIYDAKTVALQECYGAHCYYDIFNYTTFISGGTRAQWMTVYEDNCFGHGTGYSWRENPSASSSNNITTGHGGLHVWRVNPGGYNVQNSFLADVNGCYSINFGASPRESQTGLFQYNYWYQKLSGEGSANAKMILIGCGGDAINSGKYHFGNMVDTDSAPSLGEIHITDLILAGSIKYGTGTILKNYDTGTTIV